jgi:hypothetical protein
VGNFGADRCVRRLALEEQQMKVRSGFVSNSSSSSFVISLDDISGDQLDKIINHATVGAELGIDYADSDYWNIVVENNEVCGDTYIDNFDMFEFFQKIGVPEEAVEWWHS